MSVLRAEAVAKSYNGRRVVAGVNLDVHGGEVVGLLGPNGAGKTTTFHMMVGLVHPDEGKVLLNDEDLTAAPIYQRARAGISYLPQESSVFRRLTVEDNLLAILQTLDLNSGERQERCETLLNMLGVAHLAKNKAFTLSGGERRRVEIARALVLSPYFVLLDEPFTGVDPIAVAEIQKIIRDLVISGIGILITDHNVRETLGICDRAYILNEGAILEQGTPEDISASPKARKFYLGKVSSFSMALEIRQVQKLAQQLVMTPQLQQAIKLLQLSRVELEDMVTKELQENPALEEGPAEETESGDQPRGETAGEVGLTEPVVNRELSAVDKIGTYDWQEYLDTHSNSMHGSLTAEATSDDGDAPPSWENSLTKKTSLEDHLIWQLRLSKITERESMIGQYIIQNLSENGYLAMKLEEVCDAIQTNPEEAEAVLKRIQFFDPVGVAARDLRECLLVQLQNLELGNSLAARIVSNYLNFLESKRYEKLARDLGTTIDEIADAAHLITSLEPKPSRGFEQDDVRTVLPDVFVEKIAGEYVIYLNDDGVPRLRVSPLYRRMVGQEGVAEEQARQYLQEKVRAATWLIKSIQQRQQTLYRVTQSIFKFQLDFLDHGVSQLKPMVLRDVAEDIHMHESTVSRATANKYVHTPQGLFELKFFFQSGLKGGNGEDVASESVKEKIRGIIAGEDPRKPFSDQHIAALLSDSSIEIARRTVAKYREAMGILPSSKRRQPFFRR